MFKQIRFRITGIILFATFITLLIIGSLSFYISAQSIYKSNINIVRQCSNESVQITDEYMKLVALNFESEGFCADMATGLASKNEIDEKSQKQAIEYCSAFDEILEYAVLNTDRTVVFSYTEDSTEGIYKISKLPDFSQYIPAENNIFVFLTDSTDSDFNMVIPLFENDAVCGFQLIRISDKALIDLLDSQYSSFKTEEQHYFVSADGSFVNLEETENHGIEKYADELTYSPALTSDKNFFAVKTQAQCGINMVNLLSTARYNATIRQIRLFLILISLTLLVISFVIATLFAEGITKPLSKLYNKIKSTGQTKDKKPS